MRNVLLYVVAGAALVLQGCGGELIINPPPTGKDCSEAPASCGFGKVCNLDTGFCEDSTGPCAADRLDGHCRDGLFCACGGVCVVEASVCGGGGGGGGEGAWCDCSPAQGCANGVCVEPTTENVCTAANPGGVCLGGETCVGGGCQPVRDDNRCGEDRPSGFCGSGLTCVQGTCEPTAVNACGPDNPKGNCPDGQTCNNGLCQNVTCDPGTPGVCPADQVCGANGCEPLPCSPYHPEGVCEEAGTFCSVAGQCIPAGDCLDPADCDGVVNTYCSLSAQQCLNFGRCNLDEDCRAEEQETVYGQGYVCENSNCVEATTCTTAEDCVPDKYCSSGARCLSLDPRICDDTSDCAEGEKCSLQNDAIGQRPCISTECRVNADCDAGAGERCGANQRCLGPGECDLPTDCPPGHSCDGGSCAPTGALCDSNTFVSTGCSGDNLFCCEPGKTCCPQGQRCSSAGSCIPRGRCVTDADCFQPGYYCDENYRCEPNQACDPLQCLPGSPCPACDVGETCSYEGGCVPQGQCLRDNDCPLGEQCSAEFTCQPGAECGNEFLSSTSLAAPNMLVLLDRSGSMEVRAGEATTSHCCGTPESGSNPGEDCSCDAVCGGTCGPSDCPTRWNQAVEAIQYVVSNYAGHIHFGLSTYPQQCPYPVTPPDPNVVIPCSNPGNWCSCPSFCDFDQDSFPDDFAGNFNPGQIDIAVGPDTQGEFATFLSTGVYPGGGTPTGPTLRNVLSDLAAAGLNAQDRDNVILLVTDGEAGGDAAAISTCEPPCNDLIQNGDETAVDCGGSCGPCPVMATCNEARDCQSNLCQGGICRDPSCVDGEMNGTETDVDCGGSCFGCDQGQACTVPTDCASGVCINNLCAAPACDDGVQNGSETATDCGGDCASRCADSDPCSANEDCSSGVCQAGQCRVQTCGNGILDGSETDTDCGGSDCGPCALGATCSAPGDCDSNSCDSGSNQCTLPSCADGVMNNDETDVDCGGSCGPCRGGFDCSTDGDCLSGTCTTCAPGDNACRVNAALDKLFAIDQNIRTYVVGFAFDQVSTNLNCHAAHGRTARSDTCPFVGTGNCAPRLCSASRTPCATDADCTGGGDICQDAMLCEVDGTPCLDATDCAGGACSPVNACYYEASDQVSLQTAFDEIVTEVVSCSYTLTDKPPAPFNLYVYLSDGAGFTRLSRDFSETDGWNYNASTNQIEFFGTACDTVKGGALSPVVLMGGKGGEEPCGPGH